MRPLELDITELGDLEAFIQAPNSFNNMANSTIKITHKKNLKMLVLGSNCNKHTITLVISDCPQLKKVLIKENSFDGNISKSTQQGVMQVFNCRSLEKLIIKEQSFVNYSKLVLNNLPQLRELIIGTLNSSARSNNFSSVCFFELSNLPALCSVLMGTYSFSKVQRAVFSSTNANCVDIKICPL